MTDRINEALAQFDSPPNELTWENDRAMGIALGVLADAARAYVADWETCPTCNGYGERLIETDGRYQHEACPDCVDGMIPSPDAVMRAAVVLADHDTVLVEGAPDIYLPLARRVLLASRQGD